MAGFTVANGQIIAPDGSTWRGAGVGIFDSNQASVNVQSGGAALAQQMRAMMPGINLIRIANYTFGAPASYAAFVNDMTSAGVAVVFEDHNTSHTVLSGTALQNESNWYASMASYYINNPLVMFQTMNEPGAGDSAQMQATYNAIRGTGNNNLIFMESGENDNGDPSTLGNPSVYASMHNVAWDVHTYWGGNFTVSQVQQLEDQQQISTIQTVHSADGVMPVVSLEGGNSTDGTSVDQDGAAVVQATFTNPALEGFAAWIWNDNNSSSTADNMTNPGGASLNSYGQEVASFMSTGTGPVGGTSPPPPPPPPPSPTPSPDGTKITSPSDAPIVDSSGNSWSLVQSASNGLQIAVNGVVDTQTANVVLLETLSGSMVQENASGGWWSESQPNDSWVPIPNPTPAPPPPTVTPSPNGTQITSPSDNPIIDQSGNSWSLVQSATQGLQIAVNGATDTQTANVVLLETLNGAMVQENSQGGWWSETQPNDSWVPIPNPNAPPPGSVSISLLMSATRLSSNPTFIVKVDGQEIGGPSRVTASYPNNTQKFSYTDMLAAGQHTLEVDYTKAGRDAGTMYVDQANVAGTSLLSSPDAMHVGGKVDIAFQT